MRLIYNSLISLFDLLADAIALFNKKLKSRQIGSKQWEKNLNLLSNNKENVWFHCASLGEFEDAIAVFEKIQSFHPQYNYFLSFFSPSGYEVVKNDSRFQNVFYLPLDTKKNAEKLIKTLRPKFTFFSRSEIWPNMLLTLKQYNLSVFLIGALVQKDSKFLKWPARNLFKKSFHCFDFIYSQDEETQQVLDKYFNYKKTIVTGNSRIDRIYNVSQKYQSLPVINNFIDNHFCVIFGSCLPFEEKMAFNVINKMIGLPIKWIVVPHEIDTSNTYTLLSKNNSLIKYSDIGQLNSNHKILYVDSVGLLKHLYRFCDVAVVGGGFSKMGIHNILEPAIYGCAITFGPNHRNYSFAMELLEIDGVSIHKNKDELYEFIEQKFLHNIDQISKEKISQVVLSKTGATQNIINHLQKNFLGISENGGE